VPHLRLAALLAAATLLAAGCSDDDPQPRLEPTPSASLTESPSPTEPSSSGTSATAPATAVEAVRNWVRERNRALSSGDTGTLRALTDPGCSSCEPYIDLIEDVYRAGGRYESQGWKVDNAKELKPLEVTAAITMSGGVMFATADASPDAYEEDKGIFRFRVKDRNGSKEVVFIGLIP
jgi:hypothetical protein